MIKIQKPLSSSADVVRQGCKTDHRLRHPPLKYKIFFKIKRKHYEKPGKYKRLKRNSSHKHFIPTAPKGLQQRSNVQGQPQ